VEDLQMIPTTHAARRDDIGFLTRRIPKLRPAPLPARWLKIGMATCWIGAFALALALTVNWLP
jgi:hypothetical protein